MRRRSFLALGVAAAALGGGSLFGLEHLPVSVDYPGRSAGHRLRDASPSAWSGAPRRFDVVILGSGIAAWTAAWKLAKEGVEDVAIVSGPELFGNAAARRDHGLAYPTGAHYLPLPSMESMHVREMLFDLGVITANPFDLEPSFDERFVLHAPGERVLYEGQWQEGYLPTDRVPAAERDEQRRFFAQIEAFAGARGRDGRRGFVVPLELASNDETFLALDRLDFASWLDAHQFRSPTLRWYLDYCCRDDYGRPAHEVSAYAGIHYFAARNGQAANAGRGAVLTFAEGLAGFAERLQRRAVPRVGHAFHAMAQSVEEIGDRVRVVCVGLDAGHDTVQPAETFALEARTVIVAMPLYVAQHVVQGMAQMGFASQRDLPVYAPWMVSNFIMKAFPEEQGGQALAWDNVLFGQHDLGYVVSTHQDIRQSRPQRTAFSAYAALSEMDPLAGRRWLDRASDAELLSRAARDLRNAYGWRLGPCVESVEITVRGHAMASPMPGYRSNLGLAALRTQRGRIRFAHADLSGYSVFEEAAWWGYRAASDIARKL